MVAIITIAGMQPRAALPALSLPIFGSITVSVTIKLEDLQQE